MEFVIERENLFRCLAKTQGIVEKKNTMPVLSNTLLSAQDGVLEVVATDLEITLIDRCPVEIKTEGKVTVSAKKLFEIVREMPEGPMSIVRQEENHLHIKGLRQEFDLLGLSSDDYPTVPDPEEYKFNDVDAAQVKLMIERTIYACGTEEGRYSLNGIFLERSDDQKRVRFVGTDGHRLALIEREFDNMDELGIENGIILPRKGVAELIKVLEGHEGNIRMGVKENNVAFELGQTMLLMRLIEGEFPDYRRVIVEGCDKIAVMAKDELMKNIRRVSIMVDEKARAIKFTLTDNNLVMESKNPFMGTSHSEMDVEYKGEPINVGFNDRYVLDILNSVMEEKIAFEFKDEESPTRVSIPGDDNYLCVIMPMRLK